MEVDFGRTAVDYARHRAGFPAAFLERLTGFGIGLEGQRVLDLGTGAGTLARGFARRGCRVTGLDLSSELEEEAKRLDAEAGVAIDYVLASAEDTGLGRRRRDPPPMARGRGRRRLRGHRDVLVRRWPRL